MKKIFLTLFIASCVMNMKGDGIITYLSPVETEAKTIPLKFNNNKITVENLINKIQLDHYISDLLMYGDYDYTTNTAQDLKISAINYQSPQGQAIDLKQVQQTDLLSKYIGNEPLPNFEVVATRVE